MANLTSISWIRLIATAGHGWETYFYYDCILSTRKQAKIFFSNEWHELMKFLCTSHSKSSPYHPQANAQTERFNLTVENALKFQLDATNWAHKLPMVILALRTLYREEFDASAAMMLYGMDLRLPNQFHSTSTAWSDNPRAALLRHQQNVASYQYDPHIFLQIKRRS